MKNILFANTVEPACGVHQFGVNFYNNLHSQEFSYFYDQPTSIQDVEHFIAEENIQAVIVNWHPDIGGWPLEIERIKGVKKILCYHDWDAQEEKWDAVMFSDPTMKDHGKWYSTPRPIPNVPIDSTFDRQTIYEPIKIGVHGFYGASAHLVLEKIVEEFKYGAELHLHSPVATYGDKAGKLIFEVMEKISDITDEFPGIKVIPDFRFLPREKMILKLSRNHINIYVRDTSAEWKGVSSALDAAVASGRPVAINRCQGFRHMHNLTPSICLEERSIMQILNHGNESLKPFIAANTPEKLAEKVDYVMRKVLG